MKKMNFKGLRISSPRERRANAGDENQDTVTASGSDPTHFHSHHGHTTMGHRPIVDSDDAHCSSDASKHSYTDGGGTPKLKTKTSFFKTLKRKLTTNLHRKRDSSVSDDECCDKSPALPRRNCRGVPHTDRGGSLDRRARQQCCKRSLPIEPERSCSHTMSHARCMSGTKNNFSRRHGNHKESSPEEAGKVLVDTEYGHASAPITPVHTCHTTYTADSVVNSGSRSYHGTPVRTRGHIINGARCGINTDHETPSPASSPTGSLDSNDMTLSVMPIPQTVQAQNVYDQVKDDVPKSWSLTKELFKLSKYGWYWGPITRVEAEEKLTNQPDGAFLVRDSSDDRYLLSLSFRSYGRTLHTRIEHCNGVFSFYAQPESEGYTSIVELIDSSMNDSQTGVFCYSRARTPGSPSFPVRLTKPVSRFTQVRTLQYLCRFVIRQYTRLDHIQKLPLPTTIKGWLEEKQY